MLGEFIDRRSTERKHRDSERAVHIVHALRVSTHDRVDKPTAAQHDLFVVSQLIAGPDETFLHVLDASERGPLPKSERGTPTRCRSILARTGRVDRFVGSRDAPRFALHQTRAMPQCRNGHELDQEEPTCRSQLRSVHGDLVTLLVAEVRYDAPSPVAQVEAVERVLESRLVGLGPLAERSSSAEDAARTEGFRVLGLGERTPRSRRKITAKWQLARSIGSAPSGVLGASWSNDANDYEFDERPTWLATATWGGSEPTRVTVRLQLRARRDDVLSVAQRVGADLSGLLVELLMLTGAVYAYATVTDLEDEPRRFINGFAAEPCDDRPAVFGYSWMTWVPPTLATLLDRNAMAEARLTAHHLVDGSGGVLVVSNEPTAVLPESDLTALRTLLQPVLLPERLDSPRRTHEGRPCPAGLLPADWV